MFFCACVCARVRSCIFLNTDDLCKHQAWLVGEDADVISDRAGEILQSWICLGLRLKTQHSLTPSVGRMVPSNILKNEVCPFWVFLRFIQKKNYKSVDNKMNDGIQEFSCFGFPITSHWDTWKDDCTVVQVLFAICKLPQGQQCLHGKCWSIRTGQLGSAITAIITNTQAQCKKIKIKNHKTIYLRMQG